MVKALHCSIGPHSPSPSDLDYQHAFHPPAAPTCSSRLPHYFQPASPLAKAALMPESAPSQALLLLLLALEDRLAGVAVGALPTALCVAECLLDLLVVLIFEVCLVSVFKSASLLKQLLLLAPLVLVLLGVLRCTLRLFACGVAACTSTL